MARTLWYASSSRHFLTIVDTHQPATQAAAPALAAKLDPGLMGLMDYFTMPGNVTISKATAEKYMKRALLVVSLLLFGASFTFGQLTSGTPTPSFGATDSHDFDDIDLATLTPTVHIPIQSKTGAIPINAEYTLTSYCYFQSQVYRCDTASNGVLTSDLLGFKYNYSNSGNCISTKKYYNGFSIIGPDKATHYVGGGLSQCAPGSFSAVANDGSGLTLHASIDSNGTITGYIISASGHYTSTIIPNVAAKSVYDAFGNNLTIATSGGVLTDTLGVATLSYLSSSGQWMWHDTSNNPQYLTWSGTTPASENANIGCNITVNFGSYYPTTTYTYPDNTTMGINMEMAGSNTTGRIGSIKLRTGATISYSYGPVLCGGQTQYWPSTLARTTPDGTTNYALNGNTDTVLDPGNNKTVYTFTGYGSASEFSAPVLTQVQRYQNTGTVSSPTYALISTDLYCYNSNTSNCATTLYNYPITRRDIYHYVGTGSLLMSHRTEIYDAYRNTLTDVSADNITGQTVTKTYVYGTLSGGSCVALGNTNIHDHVCTATTTSGSTQIAQKSYSYNSNGAMTASTDWISSTLSLTTNYTPNTNGTEASMQKPNGQTTTYGYAASGSGGCNGLLRTSSSTTVNGVVIADSKTWDCNGGVVLTTTDPNNNGTVNQYDSMFRPSMTQDQMGKQTTYGYTSTSASSTDPMGVYRIQYVDGLGRKVISQTRQTPTSSNYDTVSTAYQWNGTNFQTQTSVPCVTTLDQPCSPVALTALNNPIAGPQSATDANSGTKTYAYSANDTSVTAGPAPTGEHVKTVQKELDGFGRTKSVCALQTSGGTACGEAMGNSGILASSSYSFGAGSSTVTQTRGSQTHTTVLDAIGRTTSRQTPEAGTVTNYYDTDPSGCYQNPANQTGFLTGTKDNSGVYDCPGYDATGRIVYVLGANGAGYCKRFAYDNTSGYYGQGAPSGYPSSGANIVGRLVEAETDNCVWNPQPTIITDEWFAYDKDGRMTDMWEKTPNSGGYYHTTATYDANGTVTSLSGIPGFAAYNFGTDGEDRPFNASQGSTWFIGSSTTTGVSFDAASKPLTVPIGTAGDSDTFAYDSLEQMKKYTFTVNGTSMSGTLVWNSIGSLGSLSITDGFDSGGAQNCTFTYDDVARLVDDNCGSSNWHQSYSYSYGTDTNGQYENLTKTGNPGTSWNPGYNLTNNQMLGASYDSDGRVTYDGVNTYTWDVYGKVSSAKAGSTAAVCGTSGYCATYDANGRLVETNASGTINQVLYGPTGRLAQMSGQTVTSVYIPLPGGADLYGNASNQFIQHPDWLGSKRLSTSLTARTMHHDIAFAPYGDTYDMFGTPNRDFTGDLQDLFQGQLFDTPNRELASNASRWNSPDPAGASWNAYAYATDPNRQTDPTGLGPEYLLAQDTLLAQEVDPEKTGEVPPSARNEKTDEIDPNAEAERALEPVEPTPAEPAKTALSPAEEVLSKHSPADIQAVRNGACSVDPKLEEAIRVNDSFNRIKSGGPFPYKQDATVFENRPDKTTGTRPLPDRPLGYYHEYTVEPLSGPTRGPMRLVTGARGEVYFTDSHYVPGSFVQIAGPK